MAVATLARKDLRLLLRDPRAAVILLAMPVVLMAVLGAALGEGFGQKPSARLRVSVVNEDRPELPPGAVPFPGRRWSEVVLDDLTSAADLTVEVLPDRAAAERLVRRGERPAVLVFGPDFSARVQRCSFLDATRDNPDPLNPFGRDGITTDALGLDVLRDPAQPLASGIFDQVAQVTLLRVVMPWMIGRAFEKISEAEFIDKLGPRVRVPVPGLPVAVPLKNLLVSDDQKKAVGVGMQKALQELFSRYDLTAKTWAQLTRKEPKAAAAGSLGAYAPEPEGLLKRGSARYLVLVPSFTVMFAFFLVLTVGWLFVAERRQGTLVRLRAAPVARWQVLAGKMLPCLAVSLAQGWLLLAAGWAVFGMSWGPHPGWLLAVAACTSVAAMGLAMLVASSARTETQVAIYGTLLVLVLAGVSGCLVPRELMPEEARVWSLATPHAWALDAYNQLLLQPVPQLEVVARACAVLLAFGAGFLALAWAVLRLE